MLISKFIIVYNVVAVSRAFTYSELLALKNCHFLDSCKSTSPTVWFMRNCKCDELCPHYGDCCLDSEYYSADRSYRSTAGHYSCISLRQFGRVYMKDTCREGWKDPDVYHLCQKGRPESSAGQQDPIANIPVTSKGSNITYINYYCAICNSDATSLYIWDTGWVCKNAEGSNQELKKDYIISSLVYKDNTWGVDIINNNTQMFLNCTVYPVIPHTLQNIVRNCSATISTCSDSWTDGVVKELCKSYISAVYKDSVTIYRNIHCALCNNVSVNDTICYSPGFEVRNDWHEVMNFDFTMLLDFSDSSGSEIVGMASTCEKTEIWDPFFRKCRSIACAKPNQLFRWNRCVDTNGSNVTLNSDPRSTKTVAKDCVDNNNKSASEDKNTRDVFPFDMLYNVPLRTAKSLSQGGSSKITGNTVASNVSKEYLNCQKIHLKNEEFIFSDNGTIHVQKYRKNYAPGEYQLMQEGVIICSTLTSQKKYSSVMAWVSLVGMGISCVCLLLHLVAFLMVTELKNLAGRTVASLCVALLASNVTFIVSMNSDPLAVDCLVLAAAKYYFFLSSFCWMNAIAFNIWNAFRLSKFKLRLVEGNQWCKFIAYSVYSWLLPALAVAAVIIIDSERPNNMPKEYMPYLGELWCWFGHRKALLVFFVLPKTILILINCVFFIATARIITEPNQVTACDTKRSHHITKFKVHMRLAVLMGFTWLTGTLAGYLHLEPLWHVFVVLNTLQGAFIFVAFTCRRRVWRALRAKSHTVTQQGIILQVTHRP